MTTLKECPFCGADQNVDHEYADYKLSPNGNVLHKCCWNCGATASGVFIEDYDTDEEWHEAADVEWNTRAGDSR